MGRLPRWGSFCFWALPVEVQVWAEMLVVSAGALGM